MTFAATAEVVLYFKANPVLVDCQRDTLNLDPTQIEAKPESLDFNPHDFGWGTLQTYVVGATLVAADAVGFFPGGWRTDFVHAREPGFSRVFRMGRIVSAIFSVLKFCARVSVESRCSIASS